MIATICTIILLAMASIVPGMNVVVFGYLLEVEGRTASGKSVRTAMGDVSGAPRLLLLIAGFSGALGVLRLLVAVASDARLIDPAGADRWYLAAQIYAVVLAASCTMFIVRRRERIREIAERGCGAVGRWLWLGLRALAITAAWLILPAALGLAAAQAADAGGFLTFIGLVILTPILARLPFLQAHFVRTTDIRSAFAWKAVGATIRAAPISCALALVASYAITLPLLLLPVIDWPRDALWLPNLMFVPLVLAARVAIGLAYRRGDRLRSLAPDSKIARGFAFPLVVVAAVMMALMVFLGPHLGADGLVLAVLPPSLSVLF